MMYRAYLNGGELMVREFGEQLVSRIGTQDLSDTPDGAVTRLKQELQGELDNKFKCIEHQRERVCNAAV